MEINQITERIIGAAIRVHRALGPGLLESTYQTCLEHELVTSGLGVEREYEARHRASGPGPSGTGSAHSAGSAVNEGEVHRTRMCAQARRYRSTPQG